MAETPTAWLRAPRLRTPADEDDRRASAYELFFDLVFVAAVAQVTTTLSRDPTSAGFLRFAALYMPIFWAWGGFTFYANRFEDDDLVYRLLQALGMLAIAAFAIDVHSAVHGGQAAVLAVSYVLTRTCLLALYLRARWYASNTARLLIDRYLMGYSAGAVLWLVSVAVPVPWRYWLWGVGLVVELVTPLFGWRGPGVSSINVAHVTERFGGFFIIVLGESVVTVVAAVAGTHFSTASAVVAIASFVIALCIWWIYFDLADTSVVGRGSLGLVYVFAHIPLLGGVGALAAGAKLAIPRADNPSLLAGARWAMAGGLACYLLSLAVLHVTAEWTSLRDRTFIGRLGVSAAMLALAALGGGLAPILFVALLAASLVALLILEPASPHVGAASVWAPDGQVSVELS